MMERGYLVSGIQVLTLVKIHYCTNEVFACRRLPVARGVCIIVLQHKNSFIAVNRLSLIEFLTANPLLMEVIYAGYRFFCYSDARD